MTTATDLNPKTRTQAVTYLNNSILHLQNIDKVPFDYNRRKSAQLLEALADLILAEARIAAWFVDLGFDGTCQIEDSSIGGIPCIMVERD